MDLLKPLDWAVYSDTRRSHEVLAEAKTEVNRAPNDYILRLTIQRRSQIITTVIQLPLTRLESLGKPLSTVGARTPKKCLGLQPSLPHDCWDPLPM